MTDLLLTEDLFLLGHDDETGKNQVASALGLHGTLAAGLLLDLALRGLIVVDERKKVVPTGQAAGHPLLQQALDAIGAEPKQRSVQSWLGYLPARITPLDDVVGRGLVDLGIVDEQRAKVLGLFPTTRWPERDPEPERRIRARLRELLLAGGTPTAAELGLVALLYSFNLVIRVVDKADRKQAVATAVELAKQAKQTDVVARSLGEAVAASQAAVIAAVAASSATAAATAAALGSS
jgi:golgi phosphoprotein 3